jgi:cytochrome P450
MSEVVDQAHELARHYDHFSEQVARDPHALWSVLRDQAPVAHSDEYGGFWILSRYEDIREAALDTETFSSAEGISIPKADLPPGLPLECDPPAHREYRRILNLPLAPTVVAEREEEIRDLAREMIAGFVNDRAFDIGEVFAAPFPKRVSLRFIGVPDSDWQHLGGLVDAITADHHDLDAIMGLFGYLAETVARRRTEPARDDLIGALVAGSYEGRPLTDEEIYSNLMTSIFGGLHTSTLLINGTMLWLLDHPDECARLVAEPALLPTAVEEFLRYVSPSGGNGRTVTRDATVAGCPVGAGDKVMLLWGSGNRDLDEFPEADKVILDREINRHLTFGVGPHRCVGSHLGKAILKIAIQELGPELAHLRVADRAGLAYVGGESRGLRALPVERVS